VKCILVTAVCVFVYVSVCLSLAAFAHYCMDSYVSSENSRGGCPPVVIICTGVDQWHDRLRSCVRAGAVKVSM